MSGDTLIEIVPTVFEEAGLFRIQWKIYGIDRMTPVGGPCMALTRHAAMGLQAALHEAILVHDYCANLPVNIVRMRAGQ